MTNPAIKFVFCLGKWKLWVEGIAEPSKSLISKIRTDLIWDIDQRRR